MDELQQYEVPILLKNLENSVKLSWEQTRWQMYSSLSPYSKKKMKVTDIFKFSWDKDDKDDKDDRLSSNINLDDEQRKQFSRMIKEMNKKADHQEGRQ